MRRPRRIGSRVLFSPSFQGLYHPRLVCLGYLFNDLALVWSLVGTAVCPRDRFWFRFLVSSDAPACPGPAKGITRLLPFASVWRDGRRCEMPSQTALMSFAFTAMQTWTWEWQHCLTRGPTITLYTHPEQCLCVAWAGYLTADVAGTILEHAFAQSGMK